MNLQTLNEASDESFGSSATGTEEKQYAGDQAPDACAENHLASKESRAVEGLRALVFLLLLVTASFVSVGAYFLVKMDQSDDFEVAFAAFSTRLIEQFHNSVERKIGALDTLALAITSHAINTGASFPNVTLPDYEIRGANFRILSESPVLNYAPLVTDETRAGWEEYAAANRDQFTNGVSIDFEQRTMQDERFSVHFKRLLQGSLEDGYHPEVHNLFMEAAPNGTGPYLPFWQQSPAAPVASAFNFNLFALPAGEDAYKLVMETGKAVMDFADNLNNENYGKTGDYILLSMSQYRKVVDEFVGDPSSMLAYPVFDSFDSETRQPSGLISTFLYWRLHFSNILPETAVGIYCILENSHNQTMSFMISGSSAKYVGAGDHHDTNYDHMEAFSDINAYIQSISSPQVKSYTAVNLSNYSQYTLRIYPSKATEDQFVNSAPVYYTLTILCIFCFTSFVFVSYDWFVARRQRIVMQRAIASGAIVSSLFPDAVRDKMYEEQESAAIAKKNEEGVKNFMMVGADDIVQHSTPIAALYPNTTVSFADIAGFTKWSSSRAPEQVFELLETLYDTFDTLATRRGVYKIETIGSYFPRAKELSSQFLSLFAGGCYMCVTGLPEPQKQHAVVMAKFASRCMSAMELVLRDLTESLGEDTLELKLRIGLHSGAVTGGVLRGQKSRFQLFGDSVNTGARMESTGEPGRIHASEATATELIQNGKSHWVTRRETKVVAKGKGEMQTYWINPGVRSDGGSSVTSEFAPAFNLQTILAMCEPESLGTSVAI